MERKKNVSMHLCQFVMGFSKVIYVYQHLTYVSWPCSINFVSPNFQVGPEKGSFRDVKQDHRFSIG